MALECLECAALPEPWEGQPAPWLYGFTVREIATALAWIASGSTYRDASARIRSRSGRDLEASGATARVGQAAPRCRDRHGQLLSDWTETFAPVLWHVYATALPTPPALPLSARTAILAR